MLKFKGEELSHFAGVMSMEEESKPLLNNDPEEGRDQDARRGELNYNEIITTADDHDPESASISSFNGEARTNEGALGSTCSLSDTVLIENDDYKNLLDVDVLSAKYESLDYDVCENSLYLKEEKSKSAKNVLQKELSRWFVMFLVGVTTGLVACFITILVENCALYKYKIIKKYVDICVESNCMYIPLLIWVACNVALVLVSSLLTVYIEPVAAGSGIPQIKCFLNGVKIPHVVRLKTLVVKVLGVVGAVGGGLCVGKVFESLRSDTEKRDFVAGGAAAGVAAAFGAPIGGVLFSLEEGASFWNQALVWRIFFASMMSTFTLNVVMSYYRGHPWDLSYPGLINFGKFNSCYQGQELPIFMIMGVIGGLMGALFNHINYKLSLYRRKYLYRGWSQVAESLIVAAITAASGYLVIYYMNVCQRTKETKEAFPVQFFCEDGYFSQMAEIFFQTPESSVKQLFHEIPGSYNSVALVIYVSLYFLLACWTYGLSLPSGLFIPSLLVGAAWGRLIGILVRHLLPNSSCTSPMMYALIGAAAQLGGVVRMTISLTVIIMEATSSVTAGFPVMVVLLIAKWIGDLFNEGLYDIHIRLQGVPLLGWEPPEMSSNISANEVMSHPVTVMRTTENVERIVEILKSETYNGFPVVEDFDIDTESVFNESDSICNTKAELHSRDFRDIYPRFPPIQQIHISHREKNCTIDLTPYMNPAAYIVEESASLPRIFRLFRALGMRHIVVLNKQHRVIGIVTRKDLARYRVSHHRGRLNMEELLISHN